MEKQNHTCVSATQQRVFLECTLCTLAAEDTVPNLLLMEKAVWCRRVVPVPEGNRKQNQEWGGMLVALGSWQVRAGSWLGRGRRR